MLLQLNELVDWAMQQRDKSRFTPCKLELINEVNHAIELLKSFANQKQIRLENYIQENICVNADEYMLRSILQNIITNAIKYTPIGGEAVQITASAIDHMLEICVQDHGIGMSEERKNMLFEMYNPTSEPGTDKEKGSGLGLLLVKDFVSQHGGSITIESEVGVGTCFKFTLSLSTEVIADLLPTFD
jgi:signal transduction histidine kinase